MDFKITLNDQQKENLKAAGYDILAEDPEEIFFYTWTRLLDLESHNKNYTKNQYYMISNLKDIYTALQKGYKEK